MVRGKLAAAAALGWIIAAVAGCGDGTPEPRGTLANRQTPQPAPNPVTATPNETGDSARRGAPPCNWSTDRLTASVRDSVKKRGQLIHPLVVEVGGPRQCSLGSRPVLWLRDGGARRIHAQAEPGKPPAGKLVLGKGQAAYADIAVDASGPLNPDEPAWLEITLPRGGGTKIIRVSSIRVRNGEFGTFRVNGFRRWREGS